MALLDFLFGRTKPVPTTTSVQQSSKLPEQIAPFVEEVLDEAQRLYGQRREEGFKEFPGETIAPRTAEELAAMEGLRGLVGTQEPYRAEAEQALRATPTQFTADEAQRLMSPYQRAVTDIEKREAQRSFERDVQPALEAKAIQAGGMSGLGTRAGLQASEAQRAQSQLLADIEAKGQQRAFEQAYRQFGDEINLQRQKAGDIQQQGQQRFNIGLAEQGLQQQIGQEDRAEAQALLNEQFAEFVEREQFPESTLAQYSSFVYGNPFLRQPDTTRTETGVLQPTTSMGQGLLNLGLTGLNIYGRGTVGGTQPFNLASVGFPTRRSGGGRVGGGLAALPIVRRAIGGPPSPTGIPGYVPTGQPAAVQPPAPLGIQNFLNAPELERMRRYLREGAKFPDRQQLKSAREALTQEGIRKPLRARDETLQKISKERSSTADRLRDELEESQMARFKDSDMLSQPIAAAVQAVSAPGMETKGFINQLAAGLSQLSAEQDKMKRTEGKEKAEAKKELIKLEDLAANRAFDDQQLAATRLAETELQIKKAETADELNDLNWQKKEQEAQVKVAEGAAGVLAKLMDEETAMINALAKKAKAGKLDDKDYKTVRAAVAKQFGFMLGEDGQTIMISKDEALSDKDPLFSRIEAASSAMVDLLAKSGKDYTELQKGMARIAKLRRKAKPMPLTERGTPNRSVMKEGQSFETEDGLFLFDGTGLIRIYGST